MPISERTVEAFWRRWRSGREALADDRALAGMLSAKAARRVEHEQEKPLAHYRGGARPHAAQLYGFDPSYHVARYNFVYKVPKSRTPITPKPSGSAGTPGHVRGGNS